MEIPGSMFQALRSRNGYINAGVLIGTLFLIYSIYSILGLGNDNDTYRMLATWKLFTTQLIYIPSRGTGYPFPELVIGAAHTIGGYYLANVLSASIAAATLWLWWKILSAFCHRSIVALAVAAIGLNATWIILAATAMDHMYALFFWTLGVFLLREKRCAWAGVVLALCVASRFVYLPISAVLFVVFPLWSEWRNPPRVSHYLVGAMLFVGITLLAYLPSALHYSGATSPMLVADPGEIQLLRQSGNWLHGNVLIWGLPSLVLLLAAAATAGARIRSATGRSFLGSPVPTVLAIGLAYHLVVYFRFPFEWKYLLPTIPMTVGLLSLMLTDCDGKSKVVGPFLKGLVGLQLLHGVVSLQLFSFPLGRYDPYEWIDLALIESPISISGRSTAGNIDLGLFAKDGTILHDIRARGHRQARYMNLCRTSRSATANTPAGPPATNAARQPEAASGEPEIAAWVMVLLTNDESDNVCSQVYTGQR